MKYKNADGTDPADRLAAVIRQHRAIENSLHWVMDMVFRDDECRIRTGHAPANFTTVKLVGHNLMRRSLGNKLTPMPLGNGQGDRM